MPVEDGTEGRGCTAGLNFGRQFGSSPEMACALYNHAVVAARSQLLGFRNRERMPVAETKLAVVCAGHSKIV